MTRLSRGFGGKKRGGWGDKAKEDLSPHPPQMQRECVAFSNSQILIPEVAN